MFELLGKFESAQNISFLNSDNPLWSQVITKTICFNLTIEPCFNNAIYPIQHLINQMKQLK